MRVLLIPLLLVAACQSPRERSIERFMRGEVLSQELEWRKGAAEARRAAETSCSGPVVQLPYEQGQEPKDYICMPPPASH